MCASKYRNIKVYLLEKKECTLKFWATVSWLMAGSIGGLL
jgi:hypothetical protein